MGSAISALGRTLCLKPDCLAKLFMEEMPLPTKGVPPEGLPSRRIRFAVDAIPRLWCGIAATALLLIGVQPSEDGILPFATDTSPWARSLPRINTAFPT
mmetsp:Transcript_29988/g.76913  ORF Transcript_29988/g.76913 Transcript_29988/m.76913 type:complete len:99 (-) Transcript_29988:985-1281(-)